MNINNIDLASKKLIIFAIEIITKSNYITSLKNFPNPKRN